jgi:hypothetical protein
MLSGLGVFFERGLGFDAIYEDAYLRGHGLVRGVKIKDEFSFQIDKKRNPVASVFVVFIRIQRYGNFGNTALDIRRHMKVAEPIRDTMGPQLMIEVDGRR